MNENAAFWEPVLQRASERPSDPAFWFFSKGTVATVTWRDLLEGAQRYSSVFDEAGVKPGHIVIILLDHSVDQYFAFLGALLVGGVPSFMPPLTSKQLPNVYWSSHAILFDRIKPRVLVISAERERQFREAIRLDEFTVITPRDAVRKTSALPSLAWVKPDDTAFLQHSSGTTHLKKGVQLTHRAVIAQVTAYASELRIVEGDRIATWLPLYHDMGLIACFIMPLVLGVPVAALDPFEWVVRPELLLQAIERYRCTITWLPNFAFHHLARTRPPETHYDLTSMRAWIDCSEPCRASTFDLFVTAFRDCGVETERLHVCYAMAETVFAVSQTNLEKPVRRLRADPNTLVLGKKVLIAPHDGPGTTLLSAGCILPGLQVSIVGKTGQVLPEDHVGEIMVSGDFVFSGYHRLLEQTLRKLKNGTYLTNDIGFIHDGELYVLGRLDDLIIINGRNFFCHEIEHVVSAISGLKPGRSVLFSVDDIDTGTQAAILVSETEISDHNSASAKLKREIRQTVLSECDLALREIYLVPPGWLIKTTSGKISRYDNKRKYLAASNVDTAMAGSQSAELIDESLTGSVG
jgi:fatty-acyl-CoA synthase